MKVFHCDHCGHLLFFENTTCLSCGSRLAYLPDLQLIGSLDSKHGDRWQSPLAAAAGRLYRLCRNYTERDVCNWAVLDHDSNALCVSCRLTQTIPDVTQPAVRLAWYRLETAKRRLVYTLLSARLPVSNRLEDPERGLSFEFKADELAAGTSVLTGHANGVITINIAEADDAERERRRRALHEPYRTLLGHMRHESGHYYWDRLIRDQYIEGYRTLFGDERQDYRQALETHYARGPSSDWQDWFVSAYASSHPWEDWAETWAHYLHMIDTIEMVATSGVSMRPRRADEPLLVRLPAVPPVNLEFDVLIESWFSIIYLLNNLNRGLGLADAYPFVLSTRAIDKLRFVHRVITATAVPG